TCPSRYSFKYATAASLALAPHKILPSSSSIVLGSLGSLITAKRTRSPVTTNASVCCKLCQIVYFLNTVFVLLSGIRQNLSNDALRPFATLALLVIDAQGDFLFAFQVRIFATWQ